MAVISSIRENYLVNDDAYRAYLISREPSPLVYHSFRNLALRWRVHARRVKRLAASFNRAI